MVGIIYSEIRNIVSGMKDLKDLGASYDDIATKTTDLSKKNKDYNSATTRINKQLDRQKGVYSKISPNALGRIVQLTKEQEYAKKAGISVSDLNTGLKRSGMILGADGKLWKDTGEAIENQDAAQKDLISSTKRFRMELLSLMFFGMMVGRMFQNFAKSADEAVGVTKLWSVFWMLVGLPAALTMVNVVTWLIDLWSRIPGPIQTFISWLGRIIYWAGLLAGSFFAIQLGWAGLVKFAPALANALIWIWQKWILVGLGAVWAGIKMAAAWVAGLGPIGWIIIAVTALIALFAILWIKCEKFRNFWKSFGNFLIGKGWTITPAGGIGPIVAAQHGGIFTKPTAALIGEAGPEAVIPLGAGGGGLGAGTVVYNPTININANISNDMDIRSLAKKLNQYLVSDLRRVTVR
jgi:hypothetical protein